MDSNPLLAAGHQLGTSSWLAITEEMNQAFADATLDPDAMEIDGQRYAHGTYTVSLLSAQLAEAMSVATGHYVNDGYLLNYGYNRIRLVEPVVLGSRIRAHFRTADEGSTEKGAVTVIPIDVTVEIEGNERPALVGQIVAAWQR